MLKTIIKKMLTISMVAATAIILTSCDETITAFLKTDVTAAMTSRVNANKQIVSKLYASGLISASEKKSIESSIDKQIGVYIESDLANNKALQERLFAAIVDWTAPAWNDYGKARKEGKREVNGLGYTHDEWYEQILTSHVVYANKGDLRKYLKAPFFDGKGSMIKPLQIIDSKTGEDLNKRFGYNIYVLKSFDSKDSKTTINSSKSLDEIIEAIKGATADRNKPDNSVLDNYFTAAKDSNNKKVTLLDTSKRSNQIVVDSIGSPYVTSSNKVTNDFEQTKNYFKTPLDIALPGYDMVIKDKKTGKVPMLAVRFHEFNSDAVDHIVETLGMNPGQYWFTTIDGENRVYIMEYPVSYVSKIKNKEGDLESYQCEFAQSNMGINLRTGKLIKYGSAWGSQTAVGQYFEDSDPYIPVSGAKNAQEEGRSAFVIEGETPDNARIEVGETKTPVKTGRIVLRDYLEATYAPDIVDNESLVVFGRKIRILNFSGSKNDVMAKYYDKEGKVIEGSAVIYADDFADFDSLNSGDPKIKHLGRVGQGLSTNVPEEKKEETKSNGYNKYIPVDDTGKPIVKAPSPTPTPTTPNPTETKGEEEDEDEEGLKESISKIDGLKKYVVSEIKPSAQFPGIKIGIVDNSASSKPLFYALAVKKNIFDSALFSGWINNTDTEKNSLDWWIKWLADDTRAYNYTINKATLEQYLVGNYTFELQQEGIVILDLETISKIQQEYSKQDKNESMKWFRTTFIVLGWIIICYSFILLLAWVVDTNVDLGFNILEKLSIGHWIAIKDADEMPYLDLGERKYITFRGLIFKVLGISVVGILFILINVVDVVIYLIEIFGGIAKMIGKLINGI